MKNEEVERMLFEPYKLGQISLQNRIVMAPLTRKRAKADGCPTDLFPVYYQQRSSAGLIIAEATQISASSIGYPNTPGIYNQEQIEAWRKVTDAVHIKGGKIFLQLWHVGRYSHPDLLPGSAYPVAPSPIRINQLINVGDKYKKLPKPKELSIDEIRGIVEDFKSASENALKAGFDGIEIHGANGYLIDQFLQDGSNQRTDIYGGNIENRSRFLFEILEAVSDIWSSDRIGLRLSPSGTKMEMSDSNSMKHFSSIIEKLNAYRLAYLHLLEPWFDVTSKKGYAKEVARYYRAFYKGHLIASGGFTREKAIEAIQQGYANLIAFGKAYISNPDLVERLKLNVELSKWNEDYFYSGGEKGYIDYPFYERQ
jgi:N-ethylmaleimide reductase